MPGTLPMEKRDLRLIIAAMGVGIPLMDGDDKTDARRVLQCLVKCLEDMEVDDGDRQIAADG